VAAVGKGRGVIGAALIRFIFWLSILILGSGERKGIMGSQETASAELSKALDQLRLEGWSGWGFLPPTWKIYSIQNLPR